MIQREPHQATEARTFDRHRLRKRGRRCKEMMNWEAWQQHREEMVREVELNCLAKALRTGWKARKPGIPADVGTEEDGRTLAQVREDLQEPEERNKNMMRIQRLGAGEALTAVGVFHTAAGLAKYRHALREMAHEGLVDAVKGDHERGEAIWFLMCGASVFLTGRLARWTELRTGTLPPSTGWMLIGIGVVGSALLPRSGFWSIFVPAILSLGVTRRGCGDRR